MLDRAAAAGPGSLGSRLRPRVAPRVAWGWGVEPIDVDELARRVREHRNQCQLSLRAPANEAGVPVNTLSRVERGFLPDLANYARITAWLGPPQR